MNVIVTTGIDMEELYTTDDIAKAFVDPKTGKGVCRAQISMWVAKHCSYIPFEMKHMGRGPRRYAYTAHNFARILNKREGNGLPVTWPEALLSYRAKE